MYELLHVENTIISLPLKSRMVSFGHEPKYENHESIR